MTFAPPHKTLLAACLLLASLAACGCDLPGRPDPANRPIPPNEVTDFDALFQRSCAGCHGREGKLGPAPPLNDPLFLAIMPETDLEMIISTGREGTLMPAFGEELGGTLTAEQVTILAKGLKTHWDHKLPAADTLPPYVGASGDAKRGEQLFANACATCHGPQGQGIKVGAGAINNVAFLSLTSDQALRRLIITGRPDLGMPDFAGKPGRPKDYVPLTSPEIDDLVALLAQWRESQSLATASAP